MENGKHETSPEPKNTGIRNMVFAVFYSAVMGTVIYEPFNIFTEWVVHHTQPVLLENNKLEGFFKVLVLVLSLAYFICDFMYGLLSKGKYRVVFILIDLTSLAGLEIIYKALNINKSDAAQYGWVSGSFAIIVLLHGIWSFIQALCNNTKDKTHLKPYYKTMTMICMILFVLYGIIWIITNPAHNTLIPALICGVTLIAIATYVWAIKKRRSEFNE